MTRRLAVGVLAVVLLGCTENREVVDVVAAASLGPILGRMAADHMRAHPDVLIRLQTGGSEALVRRIMEADLRADVLIVADMALFAGLEGRFPDPEPWVTDRLVLALRPGFESEASEAWSDLLRRDNVRIGLADPDTAPLGYRTLQALRLHDLDTGSDLEAVVRRRSGRRGLRPNAASLLAPLQSGDLDMAFLYASSAGAAGLDVVEIPARANLGDPDLSEIYARVSVETAGDSPDTRVLRVGAPVVYGLAIRIDSGPQAGRFGRQLLGPGRERLQRMGYGRPSGSE